MTDHLVTPLRLANSISCVMPAYNEAGNLGLVVPQVLAALGQLSLHNLQISAVLILPALLGVWAGLWIVRRVPSRVHTMVST